MAATDDSGEAANGAQLLADEIRRHRRWFVLTGAGVSTESGIPAYRDASGAWQHKAPIQFAEFVHDKALRERYWARSSVGFDRIARALPNTAHRALTSLQRLGCAPVLVTQNVDGLHQKAGSENVIDLHGRLDRVQCLSCRSELDRSELQARLIALNPGLSRAAATSTPDGDADLHPGAYHDMRVPDCQRCGGILKPAVVFFGEAVPQQRARAAYDALEEADAMLVIGSSLMVFSGHRFVRRAAAHGKPIVIVNRGVTRADALARTKLDSPCGALLQAAVALLCSA